MAKCSQATQKSSSWRDIPWIALLLSAIQGAAGLSLLMISSWFICASAIAAPQFNYMLPAVAVRGFALLRIASGYFHLYFAHSDLLNKTGRYRAELFEQLHDARISERSGFTEALAHHTESVASVWMGWVAQQANAIVSITLALFISLFWSLPGPLYTLALASMWFALLGGLMWLGVHYAVRQVAAEHAFRERSETALDTSAIWHMAPNQGADFMAQMDASKMWQSQQIVRRYSDYAVWCVQGVSFGLLSLMLWWLPQDAYGNALLIVTPILLLTAPDWLSRSLQVAPVFGQYRQAQTALCTTSVQSVPSFTIQEPLQYLQTNQMSVEGGKPVSLTLVLGELIVLQGPSGVGKSRWMQGLVGHIPANGQRFWNGKCLQQGLCRDMLYLPQSPQILNTTVADNLRLAQSEASDDDIRKALQQMDLAHLNINAWLGEQGLALSGGEAKRLALAQVLLNPPSVLLVDEPFEGLDHERIQLVTEHLNELKRTTLVIVATHVVPDALMVDWDYTFS